MNVFLLSLIEPQQAKYIVHDVKLHTQASSNHSPNLIRHDNQIPRITFEGAQEPPLTTARELMFLRINIRFGSNLKVKIYLDLSTLSNVGICAKAKSKARVFSRAFSRNMFYVIFNF